MSTKRELCESARKGHVCPDDLCRGNPDDTLCGFDQSFYEEICQDMQGAMDGDDDYNDSDEDDPEEGRYVAADDKLTAMQEDGEI